MPLKGGQCWMLASFFIPYELYVINPDLDILYDIFGNASMGMRREAHSCLFLYRAKRKKCSARGVISD